MKFAQENKALMVVSFLFIGATVALFFVHTTPHYAADVAYMTPHNDVVHTTPPVVHTTPPVVHTTPPLLNSGPTILGEFSVARHCTDSPFQGRFSRVEDLMSSESNAIIKALGETSRIHRKQWEFVFIIQALRAAGMLQPGKRGMVFAAGQEPLISYFVSKGVEILATDMDANTKEAKEWAGTAQFASNKQSLFRANLVDAEKFEKLVTYQTADMNHIDPKLFGTFDFVWSTCSLEHVGSIVLGQRFAVNSMDLLKPGGIAVHTTEFTMTSLTATVKTGNTVMWRKDDVQDLIDSLRALGYLIEDQCWFAGDHTVDNVPDVAPYSDSNHMKLELFNHVATSVGWVSRKPYI